MKKRANQTPTKLLLVFLSSIFLFCGAFNPSISYSQQTGNITGKVLDANSGPLQGVTVKLKSRPQVAAITDAEGNFKIDAKAGDVLTIQSVGYEDQEVNVTDNSPILVHLKTSVASLNDVVVIGYGTVRRRDLTGAVANIKGSDLKAQGVSDVTRTLQGRLPGVTVESAGGDPGSGTRILIRGVGSLGNATPLYIVDGVQVGNINNLSAGDIESIDVLKDASAAAIYGSRAANGVVIVTTKSGKAGKPVFQFSTNIGQQTLAKKVRCIKCTAMGYSK